MLILLQLLSSIKSFFLGIVSWYVEHWRFTVPLTIYIISMWGAIEWQKRQDAEAYAAKYETAVHEFNLKVKSIEELSKKSADKAETSTAATQEALDKVLSDVGIIKGKVVAIKPFFVVDKNGDCRPSASFADAYNKLGDVARTRK